MVMWWRRCIQRAGGQSHAPCAALCGESVRLRALPCVKVDHERTSRELVQPRPTKRAAHGLFTNPRISGNAEHAHGPARAGEGLEFQGVQGASHGQT